MPISENNRCGEYLKYEHIYDQIKEFRREDDPRLSQGVWKTEPKKANWQEVERICTNLLIEKTKDLQIATWLLEAWTVSKKIDGFNRGILLLLAMCEQFWDDVHPVVDWENHNYNARLSPFYFLSEKIQEKIVLIPLSISADSPLGSYTLSDWRTAQHNLRTKNTKGLSFKQLKKSIPTTPPEFLQALEIDINSSIENLKKLDDFIGQKCRNDAPSFRNLFDCLDEIKRITSKNLQEKCSQMQIKPEVHHHVKQSNIEITGNDLPPPGNNTTSQEPTIEQAYSTLEDIAIFLEKKQPQSPASALIKIAATIGKKNFSQLLEIDMKSETSIMTTISELYRIINAPDKQPLPPPTTDMSSSPMPMSGLPPMPPQMSAPPMPMPGLPPMPMKRIP
jgi:type VI secretion system protein ImpA